MAGQIHRQKKNKDFVTLDTHCLRNRSLKWDAKGLHSYLMQLPDDWKVNISDLEKRSETGRDGTRSAMDALINAGYVFRERKQGDGGKFEGYDYHFFERPEHTVDWLTVNGKSVNGFAVNGKSVNGFAVNGKSVNGKSVNGFAVNGKSDTNKDYSPTDLNKNEKTKNEKEAASPFFPIPENGSLSLEEKKEKSLQNGAAGEAPLSPPFTLTGETIEPQPAKVVRLYEQELPGVTVVDSVPGIYETAQDPRELPPEHLQRVDIPAELETLKNDEAAKVTFTLVRKIPSKHFLEYVEAFGREIGGTGETYPKTLAFRKHFFNWSSTKWEIEQRKTQKQTGKSGSHITHAGSDLSKYEQKQIF